MKHKELKQSDIKIKRKSASTEIHIAGGETVLLSFSFNDDDGLLFTLLSGIPRNVATLMNFPIDWSRDFSTEVWQQAMSLKGEGISTQMIFDFLTIALAKMRIPPKIHGRVEADLKMLSAMLKDTLFLANLSAHNLCRSQVNARFREPDRRITLEAEKYWKQVFSQMVYANTKKEPWLDSAEIENLEYEVNRCVAFCQEAARRQNMSAHERIEELSRTA